MTEGEKKGLLRLIRGEQKVVRNGVKSQQVKKVIESSESEGPNEWVTEGNRKFIWSGGRY